MLVDAKQATRPDGLATCILADRAFENYYHCKLLGAGNQLESAT